MVKKSGGTFQKREKEKARAQKQRDKDSRRLESKERKGTSTTAIGDEDPDIAGIRPGPQPLPDQWEYGNHNQLEPGPEGQGDNL